MWTGVPGKGKCELACLRKVSSSSYSSGTHRLQPSLSTLIVKLCLGWIKFRPSKRIFQIQFSKGEVVDPNVRLSSAHVVVFSFVEEAKDGIDIGGIATHYFLNCLFQISPRYLKCFLWQNVATSHYHHNTGYTVVNLLL